MQLEPSRTAWTEVTQGIDLIRQKGLSAIRDDLLVGNTRLVPDALWRRPNSRLSQRLGMSFRDLLLAASIVSWATADRPRFDRGRVTFRASSSSDGGKVCELLRLGVQVLGSQVAVGSEQQRSAIPVARLLFDMMMQYVVAETPRMFSSEMVQRLVTFGGRQWGTLLKGKPIDERWVAR